jgi:hypothetical protein
MEMSTSEINNLDDHPSRRSLSEERHSIHSSDDHISLVIVDDETPQGLKSFTTPKKSNQIPKLKTLSTSTVFTNNKSSSSPKMNSSLKTREYIKSMILSEKHHVIKFKNSTCHKYE